jgi:integrase
VTTCKSLPWQAEIGDNHRAMIARTFRREKAGKAVATVRNIRALASGIFGKAIEWGFLDYNPAQGVKVAGKKVSRDRFLQADELPRFFQSLAEEEPAMRDFILLALLTGARRANLCAMRWREAQSAVRLAASLSRRTAPRRT